MRRSLAPGLLLLIAALLVSPVATDASLASEHAPRELLVKFREDTPADAISRLNSELGATVVDTIAPIGVRVVRVPEGAADRALGAYRGSSLVRFAEPNALVRPEVIPNDSSYPTQWHLPKIEAPSAWDGARATGVLVGICDSGVASVPDLAPILRGDLGYNTVDGTTNWSPITGHGTLVAGAAAAVTDNALGVSGVAWGANIIPVRISDLSDGWAYVSDAAKCITYAADHGARVINLSYRMAGYSAIDSAATYAEGKGAVTTVAAGNDGTDPGWPDFPSFLAVSATTDTDTLAVFSNYGAFIDVGAPGISIYTTSSDGTYAYASGTSLASPLTAGVLGLIYGANPSLTAAQAKNILLSTADDLGAAGEDPYFGAGRINARRAVAAALGTLQITTPDTTAPAVSITSPTGGSTVNGTVTVSATASDNVGVTRVDFYVDGNSVGSSTTAPYSYPWTTTAVADGSHTLMAHATDAAGNWAKSSSVGVIVQNSVTDTTPPTVSVTSPAGGATVSGTVTVTADASDNVGVSRVDFYADGVLLGSATAIPYNYPWNTTTGVADGSHTLVAQATDAAGNRGTSSSIGVTVQNGPTLLTDTFKGQVGGRNQPKSASYAIAVSASGPMGITLKWGSKASLDFALYDPSGALVATGGSSSTGSLSKSASLLASAGSYRIAVYTLSGQASYTLTVTHY